MELMTQRDRIRAVVKRWEAVYSGGISGRYGEEKFLILGKLRDLDLETVRPEVVDDIIGNNTWTIANCSDCGRTVPDVVMVGENPDYESNTAYLCRECAKRAWLLFT